MKKYSLYGITLIIGLGIGYLLFNNDSDPEPHTHAETEPTATQWTCSMHPQILQPNEGDCPLCGMDLIPADANADGLSLNQFKLSENAIALSNIQTTVIAEEGSSERSTKLSGVLKIDETAVRIQTSHFGGRIEKLFVNSEGESIKKGQILALIYSPELVTAQEELLTATKVKEKQPDLYNAVRNKLKLWKLNDEQINAIESSNKIIENYPVRADFSGVVLAKLIEEGNHIMNGSRLFQIADLSQLWVEFDAFESQIRNLKVGDEISLAVNAFREELLESKIVFINPLLNTSKRTVVVRAVLKNTDGRLKPGMFAEGIISSTALSETAITVPKSAVMWTGKRSLVYVKPVQNESIFEMREVLLGTSFENHYEVVEGLSSGEEIVVNGTFTIDAAAQLQGKKSMMTAISNTENDSRIELNSTSAQKLTELYNSYLEIKTFLSQDDDGQAVQASNKFYNLLKETKELIDSNNKKVALWNSLFDKFMDSSEAFNNSDTIEKRRSHFIQFSEAMFEAVMHFKIEQKIYKQFCPMANNDQGAFWLSSEERILNPYFGASMLECGLVQEIIE